MRARDCVWLQPNDLGGGQLIQLTRRLADYWVNSVEQEQVPRERGHNRNIPGRDAKPTPGALRRNRPSTEMQNPWLPLLDPLQPRGGAFCPARPNQSPQRNA